MSREDSNRGKRREMKRNKRKESKEETAIPPKKVSRRNLKVKKNPRPVQEERHNNGKKQKNENGKQRQNGKLFPLWKIAEGPSVRTNEKGGIDSRYHTVITRHLFNLDGIEEFKTMFFIPQNSEVVLVPKNNGTPAHYKVPMGDAFVFVSTEFGEVKPGMSIEGWAELKVRAAKRPNVGPRSAFYPYVNFQRPLDKNQTPKFVLELDSNKWFVKNGNFAFTPSSGKEKTILRMSKIDSAIKIIKK